MKNKQDRVRELKNAIERRAFRAISNLNTQSFQTLLPMDVTTAGPDELVLL
jgi:hypothetical protein